MSYFVTDIQEDPKGIKLIGVNRDGADDEVIIRVSPPIRKIDDYTYESSNYTIEFLSELTEGYDPQDNLVPVTLVNFESKTGDASPIFTMLPETEPKLRKILARSPRIEAVKATTSMLSGPRKTGEKSMSDISKSKVEGEAAKERAGVPPDIIRLTSSFLEPKPRKRGGRKTNRLPSKSSRQTRSRRLRSSRGRAKLL